MDRDRQMTDHELDANEIAHRVKMRARQKFRFDLVLKMYAVMGLLVAIGAFGFFIFTMIDISISPVQQIALIAAGAGVALSIMSWLILNIRRQREFYEYEKLREFANTGELIDSWKNFEEVSRELLEFEGDKFNRYSLRSIISKLRQEEKITDADLRVLQEALEFRNMIVHGHGSFPPEAVGRVTAELSDIIAKLSRETVKRS